MNDPHVRANTRFSKVTNPEDYFYSNITRDQFERLVEFYKEVSARTVQTVFATSLSTGRFNFKPSLRRNHARISGSLCLETCICTVQTA